MPPSTTHPSSHASFAAPRHRAARALALGACGLAGLLAIGSAHATNVGVTVQVSQPGVYGRVDIGRFPQPQVIAAQPVLVQPLPVAVVRPQPVSMWVPPGHQKKWSKHCARYNACGVPVYFVRDGWYRQQVLPVAAPPQRGWDGDERGRGWDDGPGRGHGKGHGHGHGHERGGKHRD